MGAQELTLNIAVNLGRLGRWALQGNTGRIKQFLEETEKFVNELEKTSKSPKFDKTFKTFKSKFQALKNRKVDNVWAEDAFTWASILTHRAKLA